MIEEYFNYFGNTAGVLIIVGAGLLLFLLIAFVLELRTRKMFPERAKSDDDYDLFGFDDEDEEEETNKGDNAPAQ